MALSCTRYEVPGSYGTSVPVLLCCTFECHIPAGTYTYHVQKQDKNRYAGIMPTGIKYTKHTASSVSCKRRQHQYFGVNRYLSRCTRCQDLQFFISGAYRKIKMKKESISNIPPGVFDAGGCRCHFCRVFCPRGALFDTATTRATVRSTP